MRRQNGQVAAVNAVVGTVPAGVDGDVRRLADVHALDFLHRARDVFTCHEMKIRRFRECGYLAFRSMSREGSDILNDIFARCRQ